jgi:hypothetical protein
MRVPAFIMMVPAFMVPNNWVSPNVEDQAVPPEMSYVMWSTAEPNPFSALPPWK